MLKTVSLTFQNTVVDFLFYSFDPQFDRSDHTMFHKHINYEIHFALKGSYEYLFSDKTIRLSQNQMLIIPPETLHRAVDAMDENYGFQALTVKISAEQPDGFYDYLTAALGRRALENLHIPEETLSGVLSLCSSIDAKSCLQTLYLHSCATKVLYDLCELLGGDADQSFPETDRHLEVQIENMVNNGRISLAEIAAAINYSPRQTERLIKQIYGKSLTKIREDFR